MIEQHNNAHADNKQQDGRDDRRRMFKTAIASYNERAISMEVILRNISDTGVKLALKGNDFLPDHFHLYIELDGISVDCEAIWRHDLEIGAKFVSEVSSNVPLRSQTLRPTQLGEKKVSLLRKNSV